MFFSMLFKKTRKQNKKKQFFKNKRYSDEWVFLMIYEGVLQRKAKEKGSIMYQTVKSFLRISWTCGLDITEEVEKSKT